MGSFNRGEHVVAAFHDVEKAFDNVWHNGLRCNIFQLDLPTKMTHCLSDFLVGRVIQANVNNLLSNKINPKAGFHRVLSWVHYFTWFTLTIFQHRTTNNTLSIPIRWWYCTMSFQLKRTFCSKMFATGPSKLGNVVCQMKNQTGSW